MRPTKITDLVSEFKRMPSVEKVVDYWSQSDGFAALVRTKDGNAYEVTIRPAKYSKHPELRKKVVKENLHNNEERPLRRLKDFTNENI